LVDHLCRISVIYAATPPSRGFPKATFGKRLFLHIRINVLQIV
jgi:hypothetical protein